MSPSDSQYFGEQTALSIRTHSFSGADLWRFPAYIKALLQVKIAAARANYDAEVISEDVRGRIEMAARQILSEGQFERRFVVDVFQGGGAIAVHNNINESLALAAGLDDQFRNHLSASQSTADVCATAVRIALWNIGQHLLLELQQTAKQLEIKSAEFKDQGFMARTCLQDAMPTGFSSFFAAWSAACTRIHGQISTNLDQLLAVNIGGTVIGSGESASDTYRSRVIHHLSEETGLRLIRRTNLFDAAQHSDDLWNVSSSLVCLAQLMMKMARDIRLLASGPQEGFAELAIPKLIQGSAFFSAKNNPTIAETMIQAACLSSGKHHALELVLSQSELNLNVFEPMMAILVYQNLELLARSIDHFETHLLQGMSLGSKGRKHV